MNLTIEKMREIDSQSLIEKVGGIERARRIVENHATCYMPDVFDYWSDELNDYVLAEKYATASVDDLRAAIADHDRTDFVSDIRNHIAPTTVIIERGEHE